MTIENPCNKCPNNNLTNIQELMNKCSKCPIDWIKLAKRGKK